MKEPATAATNGIEKAQNLTIGLDLGGRSTHHCVLNETDRIVAGKPRQIAEAVSLYGCDKSITPGRSIAVAGDLACSIDAPCDGGDSSGAIDLRKPGPLLNKSVKLAVLSYIGPHNLCGVINAVSRGFIRHRIRDIKGI